jgi:hypothetical protein
MVRRPLQEVHKEVKETMDLGEVLVEKIIEKVEAWDEQGRIAGRFRVPIGPFGFGGAELGPFELKIEWEVDLPRRRVE